ncbi:myomegalin-like [Hippopotamus amphibius kiboko]|uniref:myomegalin-like n=1 Tax=Hippopotamus amphibius kiboko TaxID=575201 RepID=UPI0025937C18|nr:myomegalin-like [Hippopotamus amphibius kiboko]
MWPPAESTCGDLSPGSCGYQPRSKPTGTDLLHEHLGEIQNLRQRLEESICINDCLGERLEHRLSSAAHGSEHSQETECLREALLTSRSQLQELEMELEHQKVERQQLLEDLKEKQQEILHFQEERLSLQEKDSRLQHKLALLQQQCEEKQQLFQSLQSELQIHEALNGNSKKGLKAYTWDACHQVPLGSDLSCLVAEIRALRGQLEQSIQKFPNNTDPGNKQLLFQSCGYLYSLDSVASPPVRDVGMNSPVLVLPSSSSAASGSETTTFNRKNELGLDASPVMKNPPKLEGDATDGSFANKHGRHVIGHVDDYSALRQQIEEGRLLVKKVASLVRSTCNFLGLEALGTEVMGSEAIHELRSSANALHHRLEESASLLTMFWRAALPSSHGPALGGKVGESMKRELLELRTKLSRQESLLQSTAEHLKTANQQKESLEQFIFSQCEIPKGSATHSSPVTLAFQEPGKKRSHWRSFKQQEGGACPPSSQLPVC